MTNDELKDIGAIMIEDGTGQHTTDENKHVGIMVIDDGSAIQGVDSRKMIGRYKLDDGSAMRTTDSTKRIGRVRIDDGTFIRGNDSPKIRGAVTLLNADGSPYVPGGGGGVHLLNGLMGHWKFDEPNSPYASSNGNAALNVNVMAGVDGHGTGIIGGALSNNAGSYWDCVDSSYWIFPGSFTFAGWIKYRSFPQQINPFWGKYDVAAANRQFNLWWDNVNHQWAFYLTADGATDVAVGQPTPAAVVNQWNFVCAWYDDTAHTINLQVNLGPIVSGPFTGPVFHSTVQALHWLTLYGFGGVWYSDALGDESAFWYRALNSSERTQLFNGGAGWPYSSYTN